MGLIYWVCIWNTATTMGKVEEIKQAKLIKDPTERMKTINAIIKKYEKDRPKKEK